MFRKVILLFMLAMGFVLQKPAVQMIPEERMAVIRQNVEGVRMDTDYYGRFQIPDVGVDVACYESAEQSVVDAKDSAAYFYACGHWIIGDHVNQGFGAIKGCTVGDTARMVTPHGVEQYTCVGLLRGHNTGTELTDWDYKPITDLYPDTLVCYTCNENWRNVTMVFFERNKTGDGTQCH